MAIRSAQVTDLARIDEIYTQGMQLSLQGEGATHPIRLWQMLTRTFSSLLPMATPSEMLFVLEDDKGKVVGFIQAEMLSSSEGRSRSSDAVRVLNLSLAPSLAGSAGGALIDHLCSEAISRGVGRVYVRIPDGHPVLESFKAHAFRRYAQDRVFFRDSLGEPSTNEPVAGLRPARHRDLLGLFTLYLATTPKAVSQFEAPDFAQWRAVHEAEWLHRFSRTSKSLVVERNNEVVGWLGIDPGQPGRPHTVAIMARTDSSPKGELQEQLLAHAQRHLGSHGGAIWSNVRNYDTATTRVLQDAGFEHLAGQELLVRELRAQALAPARKSKKEKAMAPVWGAMLPAEQRRTAS